MVHGVGFDKADDIGALTGLDYPDAAAGSRVFALRQGGAIDKDFRAAGEIGNVRREVLLSAGEHFRAIFLTSTLSHLKALILFAINLKLHTTAFAFLKALLLFLLGFYHNSGFIRFGLNSAQIQLFYAALSCAPAWRLQRYKSLVARA